MNTTKLLTIRAAAALCLFAYSANAFVAAPPPKPFNRAAKARFWNAPSSGTRPTATAIRL